MYPFYALKAPLLLYPFRYFDPIRRRWVRARYVAERHVIESSYEKWEITGPPEIRRRGGHYDSFNPFRQPAAHLPTVEEPPPHPDAPPPSPPNNEPPDPPVEEPPPIEDQFERFLVLLFLRRYATWCVRTRRFGSAEGAKRLWRVIMHPPR
jgi:hypothetical protein